MIDEKKLIEDLRTWDMQDLYLPVHFMDLVESQPKVDVSDTNVGKSDLISRSALLEALSAFKDREHGNEHFIFGIETAKEIIENQPTSYNDGWIPCSERLPKNEQEVEISCKRTYIGAGDEKRTAYITARAIYTDGTLTTEDSDFVWNDFDNWKYDEEKDAYIIPEGWWEYVTFSEEFGVVDAEVLAWMPLPAPYKEEK